MDREIIGRDGKTHGAERSVETGFGGSERDAEGRCHFRERDPQEVVQDDDGPPLWLESPEGLIQHLAVGDRGGGVAGGRAVKRAELHLDDATLAAPGQVDARMHDELAEPGIEAIGIAKGGQVAPGSDESVLHGIACELRISQDQPGGAIEACDGGAGQLRERIMVAALGSIDEISLIHGRPWWWRGRLVAPTSYGVCIRMIVPEGVAGLRPDRASAGDIRASEQEVAYDWGQPGLSASTRSAEFGVPAATR